MNPYLSFGIAMCLIVGLSLAATAYVAVMFNRRAKADLLAALTPLGEIVAGDLDLEEAAVTGRYRGHIAQGRVANSPDGPGRVFFTSVIDGAGGVAWKVTARRGKEAGAATQFQVEGLDGPGTPLRGEAERLLDGLLGQPGWLRVEYDPAPGHLRLTRPMATRRDIPSAAAFGAYLDGLAGLAAENRSSQTGETSWIASP